MAAASEFELIARYLRRTPGRRADVVLGNGDDAAILRVPPERDLVVSTDTLVAGVHFPAQMHPADIGFRSLAVNLSDLAAMGAAPAWASLALTLPAPDESWLRGFAGGFFELADVERVELVGGDLTRGPLCITVTVHGLVPKGQGMRRSGARPGDGIYVSGTLGDARLALDYLDRMDALAEAPRRYLHQRYARPLPRLGLGAALRPLASSGIDVSDGLAADLCHLLEAGGVGAEIEVDDLPISPVLRSHREAAAVYALSGGDDYELCFTLPQVYAHRLPAIADRTGCPLTLIGRVTAEAGLRILSRDGSEFPLAAAGFQHF